MRRLPCLAAVGAACLLAAPALAEDSGEAPARWRNPHMSRARPHLRVSALGMGTPRAEQWGYTMVKAFAIRGGISLFPLRRVRIEAIAEVGETEGYRPYGGIGARVLLTSKLSLFRLAGGVGMTGLLARDGPEDDRFGWLGYRVSFPAELGFEITERVGFTIFAAPTLTKPGDSGLSPVSVESGASLDIRL